MQNNYNLKPKKNNLKHETQNVPSSCLNEWGSFRSLGHCRCQQGSSQQQRPEHGALFGGPGSVVGGGRGRRAAVYWRHRGEWLYLGGFERFFFVFDGYLWLFLSFGGGVVCIFGVFWFGFMFFCLLVGMLLRCFPGCSWVVILEVWVWQCSSWILGGSCFFILFFICFWLCGFGVVVAGLVRIYVVPFLSTLFRNRSSQTIFPSIYKFPKSPFDPFPKYPQKPSKTNPPKVVVFFPINC